MNKKISQRWHAKRRIKERLGRELNTKQLKELTRYISSGIREHMDGTICNFVRRQSRRVSHFEIVQGDERFIAVYDKIRGEIVTILLHEEEYQASLEAK